MKKLKSSLLFALPLIPIAAVAGYFTMLYQLKFMDEATVELAVSQLGSMDVLMAVYIVQTAAYAFFCGFVGHILAGKLGLMKPMQLEKKAALITLAVSLVGGVIFSLDYWTFGAWIPGVRETTDLTLDLNVVLSSVLYGGIVEELMLRLFLMSLVAWLIWKLFFRKEEKAPVAAIMMANVVAAMLFAAGHLPATQMLLGELTPLVLIRCFLFNGGFGMLFGWLYRKYGIQYSMLCHTLLHLVSKLIWVIFV